MELSVKVASHWKIDYRVNEIRSPVIYRIQGPRPRDLSMGRKAILTGFWLVGFAIGFFGYLVYPNVADFLMAVLPTLFASRQIVGAFLSGIAGSIITTVTLIMWSYLSR